MIDRVLGMLVLVAAVLINAPSFADNLRHNRLAEYQVKFKTFETDEVLTAYLAYKKEDYARAMRMFLPPAIEGNAIAQYHIGEMYYLGRGVQDDNCLALLWLEKAARLGHPVAAYLVADMQSTGDGIRSDKEMAYRWAVFAQSLGHPRARNTMDEYGLDFSADRRAVIEQEAINWDPSTLPQPEYFFYSRKPIGILDDLNDIEARTGVSFCRFEPK